MTKYKLLRQDRTILCEVEVTGDSKNDKGLKRGYRRMRVVKDLSIPEPTTEQRIKFAIYCALEVYDDPNFKQWANNWLSGTDRSAKAAGAAARAARAAWAAEAARAAEAAAWAARAARAAWAAKAAWAAWAAWATKIDQQRQQRQHGWQHGQQRQRG